MARPIYSRKDPDYKFLQMRHRGYVRHKAQCQFRGEQFDLTVEDWEQFWPTKERWACRGRAVEDLMMTRYDNEAAWDRYNCCLITRLAHFNIVNKRRNNIPYEKYFIGAITIV